MYKETEITIPIGGEEIFCLYNYVESKKDRPLIIILPPFEGSARSCILPFLFLIKNGYDVVRFDFRNHVGKSSGRIENCQLSKSLEDINSVIVYLEQNGLFRPNNTAFLSLSLSSRLAYRYLALNPQKIACLVSIFGVIDTVDSIQKSSKHQVKIWYEGGQGKFTCPEKTRIIKYPIKDTFLEDGIEHDLLTKQSLYNDIKRIDCPISIINSEDDNWVDIKDVKTFIQDYRHLISNAFFVKNANHEFYKNVELTFLIFEKAIHFFNDMFNITQPVIEKPTVVEFLEKNTLERVQKKVLTTVD